MKSAYGFAEVWVHISDNTECNDPEITAILDKDGNPVGLPTCYAHEQECRKA